MLGNEWQDLLDRRADSLVEDLDRCKSNADKLLIEFRKAMSDRNTLAKKLETPDGVPPILAKQAIEHILSLWSFNYERYSMHSIYCAIKRQELPSSPFQHEYTDPVYSEPGPCNCGVTAKAAESDALIAEIRKYLPPESK